MQIDRNKVKTQDDLPDEAPIDQIEERVGAKMKSIEGRAKKKVGEGLQDKELAQEGEDLKSKADSKLKEAREQTT